MFSPSAENLAMPGRPLAAPRSRWLKLPVRARSSSQSSKASPLARRSALSRANRSLASFSTVVPAPAAGAVAGAAVVLGLALVLVVGAVVVGAVPPDRPARVVGVTVPPGMRANSSVTQRQPHGAAPTPSALNDLLRMLARRVGERISARCACSTSSAQLTFSAQALAGWTALARPTLADERCSRAIRADWAPATSVRRGRTFSAGRCRRARSAFTSPARRTVSDLGAAAATSRPSGRPVPGLAPAGTSIHASTSGKTIRTSIRRLATHGGLEPGRAWAPPLRDRWLRTLQPLRRRARPSRSTRSPSGPAHAVSVPLAQWGDWGRADDAGTLPNPPAGCQAGGPAPWPGASLMAEHRPDDADP